MIEKAEGHGKVAQAKLLHFIGQYPHSSESDWINGGRAPARVEGTHETEEPKAGTKNLESSQSTESNQKEVEHEAQ